MAQAGGDCPGMIAEALHTEVVQAQVMPFDTGRLEEDSFFADYSHSRQGEGNSGRYTLCAAPILPSRV